MVMLVSVLGAVALLIFVLAPLRRPPVAQVDRAPAPAPTPALQALLDQREAALAGLTELDWDQRLGNLNRDDYVALQGQYRQQAIGVLKALDAASGGMDRGLDSGLVAAPPVRPAAALPSGGRSRA
ncbi:MAG: hypothetical protein M3Z04_17610, partial [Chloroflexota bacterium]|nr:hypothetical protein [Chloroflexota bacterium]